jgi:hypothetical protein
VVACAGEGGAQVTRDAVRVVFDRDGTDSEEFEAAWVSVQTFADGRGLVRLYELVDGKRQEVRAVHYRRVHRIDRLRSWRATDVTVRSCDEVASNQDLLSTNPGPRPLPASNNATESAQ